MSKPAIIEQPESWQRLQAWLVSVEDPLRPWNISAISRQLQMPQATVRSLLRAPKDDPGMMRTAFTRQRLRLLEQLFAPYGYRPANAPTPSPAAHTCCPLPVSTGIELVPFRFDVKNQVRLK